MTYIRTKTQTGEAMIVMTEVVAIVRHLPNRENFNVDLHMKSGTIFTIPDYNEGDYMALLDLWEMFNRDQWWGEDTAPRSPGYVEGGKAREL